MADDQATAIGELRGEVKHISQDLARSILRINELSKQTQIVSTKLDTLVESGNPLRERMLDDLAAIKASVATIAGIIDVQDHHGRKIEELEAFRNKSLGVIGIVGGVAGTIAAAAIALLSKVVGKI